MRQRLVLLARVIKIRGRKPCGIGRPQCGPVRIRDRKPRSIAAAAFYNCMVAKDALVGKAQTLRRTP